MKVSFKLGLIWKIHVVTAVTLACTVGISSPCARPDATVCVLLGVSSPARGRSVSSRLGFLETRASISFAALRE